MRHQLIVAGLIAAACVGAAGEAPGTRPDPVVAIQAAAAAFATVKTSEGFSLNARPDNGVVVGLALKQLDDQAFPGSEGFVPEPDGFLFHILSPGVDRDRVIAAMAKHGVHAVSDPDLGLRVLIAKGASADAQRYAEYRAIVLGSLPKLQAAAAAR